MNDEIQKMIADSLEGGVEEKSEARVETGGPVEEQVKTEAKPEGINVAEVFGEGFSSLDEVKSAVERAKSFGETTPDDVASLRQMKQDYEAAQKELGKYKTFTPYKNQDYYRLDKLEQDDPDNLNVYQQILFGKPNDMDLVRADTVKKNPAWKEETEKVQRRLEYLYPALFDEDLDAESEEYQRDLNKLEFDASQVRSEFKSKIDSIEVPEGSSGLSEQKHKELAESWNPHIPKLRSAIEKISTSMSDDKGKVTPLMDIEVPKERLTDYVKKAAEYILQNGIAPTEDNVKNVGQMAKSLYIIENINEYNAQLVRHAIKNRDSDWAKEVHNPKTKDSEVVVDGSANNDSSTRLFNSIVAKEGI